MFLKIFFFIFTPFKEKFRFIIYEMFSDSPWFFHFFNFGVNYFVLKMFFLKYAFIY